jgi:hypothetical protein
MSGYLLMAIFPSGGVNFGPWQYMLTQLFAPLLQLAAGLYLFFGGKWVADKAIPSNRPYCHECGYDLTGAVGNICAECGTPFKSE